MINQLKILWAGHVAHMGEEMGVDNIRISGRWDLGIWTGLGWPWIGTGGRRL